jgi:hypothetical protein
VFRGLEPDLVTRYDENHRTVFHAVMEESGEEYGEVVFGPDIYPGQNVVDANATLGITAAAAHECTHYHRWQEQQALAAPDDEHLDEALTSLEAIQRYHGTLSETDVRQLVADAIARIHLFIEDREGRVSASRARQEP